VGTPRAREPGVRSGSGVVPVSNAEYEALATFRYALRQFLSFSAQQAQAVGLTAQQHQALLAIRGSPERDRLVIGELADRLQIQHHSAVGLVDRLEAQGLVTREHAQADRRQVFVALTPQGVEVLGRLAAAHREELRRIGPLMRDLLARLDPPVQDAG
jgi:DNA-binding MarR family transcriptional regulator